MLIRILNLICGQPDLLAHSRQQALRALLALPADEPVKPLKTQQTQEVRP